MDAHFESIRRGTRAQTRLAITIDQRPKPVVLTSDDRDHEWDSKCARTNERARRTADTEPNRQQILRRAGINSLSGECRAMFARPMNVRVLANLQKQIELLGKERIVVLKLQPEERKCFDE